LAFKEYGLYSIEVVLFCNYANDFLARRLKNIKIVFTALSAI